MENSIKSPYTYDRVAISAAVARVNGRLARYVSETDIERALAARAASTSNVVRVWGGFVAKSYGYRAQAAVLALYRDGTWRAYRGSCNRRFGRGTTLTECAA